MGDTATGAFRRWIIPTGGLAATGLCVFWGFYASDVFLQGGTLFSAESFSTYYGGLEAGPVSDAGGALAATIGAILGIVITVVSIIVQLSASRYAGVPRMFLSDRISQVVLGYYIVSCVAAVWLGPSVHQGFVPRLTVLALLLITTLGVALMVPYFGYVFWFLDPIHIIARNRRGAQANGIEGAQLAEPERSFSSQAAVIEAMEELSDICSSSISGKDKIIASEAVDALKDFTLAYIAKKNEAAAQWFRVGPKIRHNPDFVAMDPQSIAELEERRTWVEWKVMRQYLGIYNEALTSMRDINYLIAIDTRYVGEAAIHARDAELLELVVRFMNSYLRATLNARDVRTAYNVLNQYRLLVEAMLRAGLDHEALQATRRMRYYGSLAFEQKLMFVTETIAFDVSALCEQAYRLKSGAETELIVEFLKLDQPPQERGQEQGLLGVRKAQVKLACFYLEYGEAERARRIADDMVAEPNERLALIHRQLLAVQTKDYWEIIDRGRNFEFMPEAQRVQLSHFFSWFEGARSSLTQSP